jgi:hypothetical protein
MPSWLFYFSHDTQKVPMGKKLKTYNFFGMGLCVASSFNPTLKNFLLALPTKARILCLDTLHSIVA